jgi:hypothetical protein
MKKLLREPLVHFLLLGGLFFLWFQWKGGASGPGTNRIVVTPGQVLNLASGYTKTWSRPPSEDELKGLIDEYVKEEIATREAMALGLDRDDTVIRQRLRQKLEFLSGDASASAPPTDAEIGEWVKAHPEAFGGELRLSFRQVFVRADRGKDAGREAERILSRLRGASPDAASADLGDATMLPGEMPPVTLREVSAVFGDEFARRLAEAPAGAWSGPLPSSYGLHLVLVSERVEPETPSLAAVRPLVTREILAERRRTELAQLYERLLAKYRVTIEMPKVEPGPAPGPAVRRP